MADLLSTTVNGNLTVTGNVNADLSKFTSGILPLSRGGTGGGSANAARNKIGWIGTNPVTSVSSDTPSTWSQYGLGCCMYNTNGMIHDQPAQYGIILNVSQGASSQEIRQVWFTQAGGTVYHRGANASGWAHTWRAFLDADNYKSYNQYDRLNASTGFYIGSLREKKREHQALRIKRRRSY